MIPYNIVGREIKVSNPMWNAVHDYVESLERFYDRIIRCDIAISAPHRHSRKGNAYHIRIHIQLPGEDVIVNREAGVDGAHEDFYVALRDAFRAAKRKLQDRTRQMKGQLKHHEPELRGYVDRIFHEDGYGFIKTVSGREVYFHENSLVGGLFEDLKPGSPVRFSDEIGEHGPQATTVHPESTRPHIAGNET